MSKYKLSFTAVSFMINEMLKVAELYRDTKNWSTVKKEVLENNLLQKKTITTSKRMFPEFQQRIINLTEEELNLLVLGTYSEQKQMNLLAICKTYNFIYEFIVEVVRDKYLEFKNVIKGSDFDIFLEDKQSIDPELEELTSTTKAKLKDVTYKILIESELILDKKSGIIKPLIISEKVREIILKDNPNWLKIFLLSDSEIKKCLEAYKTK